ncbi:hypothetical protein HOK51_02095 [Candidatus Woesearchaeota archaeon]|jgi:hypothetical protein|nr:hypothetical protein [Candidatus Woesearchaeota archaeon]MBT6518607.1 hypothetical protein [Candidatus Woesearchaeota archaeon]MBT7368753.1 hypothetical protein [Candidatus Woesearchaeota archaeon]
MSLLYLRLDASFAETTTLVKRIPESKLDETIESLILYMCDTSPDVLNPELIDHANSCYSFKEVRLAQNIEDSIETIQEDNPAFVSPLKLYSLVGDIPVIMASHKTLANKSLAEYKNKIITTKKLDNESYKIIDLILKTV